MPKLNLANFAALMFLGCQLTANNQTRLNSLKNPEGNVSTPTASPSTSPTPSASPALATVNLIPDGNTEGSIAYYSSFGFCELHTNVTSAIPAPGTMTGAANAPGDYALVESTDNSFYAIECYTPGFSNNSAMVEFNADAAAAGVTSYASVTVTWVGSAGNYAGACSGAAPTANAVTTREIQAYHSIIGWTAIGSVSKDPSTVAATLAPLSSYLNAGKVWVRILTQVNAGNLCSVVSTDSIRFAFNP